jgi:hypothetical protein
MRLRPLFTLLAILSVAATSTACTSEAWITPLAPPRPACEADCPVTLTPGAAPKGTENLGIVRCNEMSGSSDDCIALVKERARSIGGNVIYGAHWESAYRSLSLVGTIGFSPLE